MAGIGAQLFSRVMTPQATNCVRRCAGRREVEYTVQSSPLPHGGKRSKNLIDWAAGAAPIPVLFLAFQPVSFGSGGL
jgi:hypothetical protein